MPEACKLIFDTITNISHVSLLLRIIHIILKGNILAINESCTKPLRGSIQREFF